MHRFLIVDDSIVCRQLVARLVQKHFEASVVHAVDGEDALRCLERDSAIDVILSDFLMPNIDGLGLLAAVRERYSLIPVIILTGSGSEEVAVRALAAGAASYIPKLLIQQELPEVIKTVLGALLCRHRHRELSRHLVCHEVEFSLPNDRDMLSAVVADLQDLGYLTGLFEECQMTRIGVGLEEALTNAMIHGNLEVSSALRENEDGSYERAIETRRQTPPYRDRRILIRSRFTRNEARFTISDEGSGFDPSAVLDPTDPENCLRPSGRGLLLIRSFMDETFHNAIGNEITLVKRAQVVPVLPDEDHISSPTRGAASAEHVDLPMFASL